MSIDIPLAAVRDDGGALAHGSDSGCNRCPLRQLPPFQPVSAEELALIEGLKRGEPEHPADALLIEEGQADGPLYTLLDGWAFSFKTLQEGRRRQILAFLLPGDFIGLQQKMDEAATHGVRTLTPVRVCSFRRDALWTLHRQAPSLGYDLTWLAAHSESSVDDNLLSVGRRSAIERVAAMLLDLHSRTSALDPSGDGRSMPFPLTQVHIADAMGLSLVHVNRTLRQLSRLGLYRTCPPGRIALPDPAALAGVAQLRWPLRVPPRPLI